MLLKLINPNSSVSMTEAMERCALRVTSPGTTLLAATAAMGPPAIEGHYDEACALPGLLAEIISGEEAGCEGYVIACFGDPGLEAARECARGPVVGIAEAAMHMATMVAPSFSVVTTLARTCGMAWQLAAGYGLEKFCRNVHATDLAVLELEKGNAAGLEKVIAACRRALMEDDSEAIVLGCAGMAPWHPAIQEALDVPVIDGVTAAVRQVESLVALGLATSKRQEWAHPIPKTYSGWLAALSPSPVSTQPRRPVVRLSRHEAPASAYPRDLVGYGRHPVQAQWPGNVRLSIQFVLNYEEGGESCVLHGDPISERFLSEIVSAEPYAARHMSMESIYEYGSRVGVWRILREFERRALPLTVFAVGMAIERHPDVGKAFVELGHEIACHGYKWIHYQHVPPDIEAAHMRQAMAAIERLTGTRPQGWYTGRDSPQTRRLVVEHGGFLYDSDYYGDDLPFWTTVSLENGTGMPHLVVPYTLDANDMRFATPQGFNTAQHFFEYLRDTFDVLYAEGGETPRMMSVGLHCRLIGRPGRLVALQRFLDHVERHDRVWVTRRIDIARHWHEHHPFPE